MVVALSGSGVLGAANDRETGGHKKGRFWPSLEQSERPAYLEGLIEGWNLRDAEDELRTGKVLVAMDIHGLKDFGELADHLLTAAGAIAPTPIRRRRRAGTSRRGEERTPPAVFVAASPP